MFKKLMTAFIVFALSMTKAHAELELVITGGVNTARPIAVLPFEYNGSSQLPENIAKVISDEYATTTHFGREY